VSAANKATGVATTAAATKATAEMSAAAKAILAGAIQKKIYVERGLNCKVCQGLSS